MSLSYDFHLFICQNQRPEGHQFGCCLSKGSNTVLTHFKRRVKELNLRNICVTKSGCLGQCNKGPVVVIYPEGTWYRVENTEQAEEILQQHLMQHQRLTHLEIDQKL